MINIINNKRSSPVKRDCTLGHNARDCLSVVETPVEVICKPEVHQISLRPPIGQDTGTHMPAAKYA